jgi:hypothetical protein
MTITANLDSLSDEGLDLLMRLGLKIDVRQVDDWNAIGALIDRHKITVTFIDEGLWSAAFEEISEFGRSARVAVAGAIIRHTFPEGPCFGISESKWRELFTDEYL